MKNKLIIIRGPLGIGKSSISKELSKIYKAKYFSIDEILLKNNLDNIPENESSIPINNFLKVNEIILPKIIEILKSNTVIIDGNFYFIEQIEDLLQKVNTSENIIITLKATIETCIRRDFNRKTSYGKNATIAIYNLVSKFDYGITININDLTLSKTIKKIINLLN